MNGREWVVVYLYCGEEGVEDGYGGEEAGQRGEGQGTEQQLGGALVLQAVHPMPQYVALLAPEQRGAGRHACTGHHRQAATDRLGGHAAVVRRQQQQQQLASSPCCWTLGLHIMTIHPPAWCLLPEEVP